jgi:hypothetical protein
MSSKEIKIKAPRNWGFFCKVFLIEFYIKLNNNLELLNAIFIFRQRGIREKI